MTYTAEVFFNGYTGTYWQQYGLFFTKETDLTGYHGGFTPAHLWFLLYLFIISLTALLIVLLQKKCLPQFRVGNVPYFLIILLFVPEWLLQYVLNIGGKSLGQSKLNVRNRLSVYLTKASFPVYILHMPVLVVTGFFVLKLPVGVAGQFLLIVLISLIAAFLIYEIVKRVPVLRFFLGITKQKL